MKKEFLDYLYEQRFKIDKQIKMLKQGLQGPFPISCKTCEHDDYKTVSQDLEIEHLNMIQIDNTITLYLSIHKI